MLYNWRLYVLPSILTVLLSSSKSDTDMVHVDDTESTGFIGEDETDCPDPLHKRFIPDLLFSSANIPMGIPKRSYLTAPEGWVSIAPSKIPGAGLGAFAQTFLPAHTWLGEYEGEVVTVQESEEYDINSPYMWEIKKNGTTFYYVDAQNGRTSNWQRYVNCARHASEQNTEPMFCYGKVYYMTSRDVAPGVELLTYYGDDYAEDLGINAKSYFDTTTTLNV